VIKAYILNIKAYNFTFFENSNLLDVVLFCLIHRRFPIRLLRTFLLLRFHICIHRWFLRFRRLLLHTFLIHRSYSHLSSRVKVSGVQSKTKFQTFHFLIFLFCFPFIYIKDKFKMTCYFTFYF
jgi:hypothetical protein